MKKFADTVRRLLSIALNLFIVWAEPIALPMSWDWGKEQMFIFYTEDSNILSACICAMVAVGQLVCIFTGRELPRWLHTLKYIATCCLTMTFLTQNLKHQSPYLDVMLKVICQSCRIPTQFCLPNLDQYGERSHVPLNLNEQVKNDHLANR